MSSLLVALVSPLGSAVVAAAAVIGAEELGIPIGVDQVTGGLVAYLILQRVFDFIRDKRHRETESEDSARRLEVQQEIAGVLRQQTSILERMENDQASILQISHQYQATGVCPLTSPDGQERVVRAISKEVRRDYDGRRSG